MDKAPITKEIEELLSELHERKQWLDMMIQGLEAAVSSPEHQLIASVEEVFDGEARQPMTRSELQRERRAALETLARSVSSSPTARRRRSLAAGQAEST